MWKLALVHHEKAQPALLDSYTAERHKTARDLISGVGTATRILTLKNPLVQKIREQLAGLLLNTSMVRNWMGRDVAMLDIEYRDSPIAAEDPAYNGRFRYLFHSGGAGFHRGPSAGMRAPNVILPAGDALTPASLFDLYRGTQFTLMLFSGINGPADPEELLQFGNAIQGQYSAFIQPYVVTVDPHPDAHGRNILVDQDQAIHRRYAAMEPCLYLIRPDQHIAYRSGRIDRDRLTAYLDRILVRNL